MSEKEIRLNIRLSEDLRNEFRELCKENAVNSSELIRQFVEKWVRDHRR